MKFRELERLIKGSGWVLECVRGSHYQYTHSTKSGKVTIPYQNGDIPIGTLNSILKQAGLKE